MTQVQPFGSPALASVLVGWCYNSFEHQPWVWRGGGHACGRQGRGWLRGPLNPPSEGAGRLCLSGWSPTLWTMLPWLLCVGAVCSLGPLHP